ncbi:sensor domain-containing diguanylate cyclase [Oleiagrimonas soli]|uniref:diguanylate cyclase n=1 Tax=Oleiagrimonas soli TaxID=1543381 RepID=A0A841KIL3_9GAMM|nr:GGDEF domain-containing protein [Oleiagrimonas soli]MBB6183609.1 diguanylate cyclase (GGDEF)-like protein [Oleiagrimonas soli]
MPSLLMAHGRSRRFRRRLVLIAIAAIALVLGLASIVAINAHTYREYNGWTRHSYQVQEQLLRTGHALRSAESGLRGYLLTSDTDQLDIFFAQLPDIDASSALLVQMTIDSPQQHARALKLRSMLLTRIADMRHVMSSYHRGGADAARQSMRAQLSAQSTHPIAAHIAAMEAVEQKLLSEHEAQRLHSATLATWFTVACLLSGVFLLVSAVILVIREQRIRLRSNDELAAAYAQLAEALEESRGLADRMHRLHLLSESLQNCRSIREALHILPPSLEDMLPDTAGVVALINASRNLAEKVAEWGRLRIHSEAVFTPDDCLALRRGQPYPGTDTRVKIRCTHLKPEQAEDADVTWLCIPLLTQGETLGVLHIQHIGEMHAEEHDLAVTLGEQLGLMLGNLKLQETLRIQSIRDPLTGLFNRRYLEVSLNRELLRSRRHGRSVAVMMLDMDHFKRFNDTHGHDAGDELLQQFAAVLRDNMRAEDIACRYGGEEFVLILPEVEHASALQRAEDIRQAVAAMKVRHQGALLGTVTVSIGVAMQDTQGSEPGTLLHAADQALYRAKNAGRNRIEVAAAAETATMTKDTD